MPRMSKTAFFNGSRSASRAHPQRGAATLIVVMVLFFIMAMMAAFANRNLMFEQRIAANYYRSGVAFDAAEAGAEWALAMLNSGNVNGQCQSIATASLSFKNRYLTIDPQTRFITALRPNFNISAKPDAACVRVDGTGWQCQCSNTGWTVPAVVAAATMQPSFTITIQPSTQAGVMGISSLGCTASSVNECLAANTTAVVYESSTGKASVSIQVALVSALKMPPPTPLTIAGAVSMDATGLGLHNSDPRSSGLLMVSGGANSTGWIDSRLDSLPGTPPQQALISADPALSTLTADKLFATFFGMSPARYQAQPAMRVVTCSADCATDLVTAYGQGVRLAWIDGAATLGGDIILGTAANPMLVVVNGALTITGPKQIFGLLYARGNIVWTSGTTQPSLLTGALIGEGTLRSAGLVDIVYQAAIMNALSNQVGSFVRVPGSWNSD